MHEHIDERPVEKKIRVSAHDAQTLSFRFPNGDIFHRNITNLLHWTAVEEGNKHSVIINCGTETALWITEIRMGVYGELEEAMLITRQEIPQVSSLESNA